MMMSEAVAAGAATRRSFVVRHASEDTSAGAAQSSTPPEMTLLSHMGHDVSAVSPDEALSLLQRQDTDVVVVDVSGWRDRQEFVNRLSDVLEARQARHVAVFTDQLDDYLKNLRDKTSKRVHVFLKPLHLHGLLHVLKNLTADTQKVA